MISASQISDLCGQKNVPMLRYLPAAILLGETMDRLRRRRDFLLVSAQGRKAVTGSLILLARPRPEGAGGNRVGFTVSRKVGNAVTRNRVRRRLREAVRSSFGVEESPACDYVIIARKEAADRPLSAIRDDLTLALSRIPQDKI